MSDGEGKRDRYTGIKSLINLTECSGLIDNDEFYEI